MPAPPRRRRRPVCIGAVRGREEREREGERGRERERERESVRFAVTLGAAGQEYPYQPDGLQPLGHVVHLLGKRADFTIHTGRKTPRRRRAARRVTRSPRSLGWASFAPRRTCDCCSFLSWKAAEGTNKLACFGSFETTSSFTCHETWTAT